MRSRANNDIRFSLQSSDRFQLSFGICHEISVAKGETINENEIKVRPQHVESTPNEKENR